MQADYRDKNFRLTRQGDGTLAGEALREERIEGYEPKTVEQYRKPEFVSSRYATILNYILLGGASPSGLAVGSRLIPVIRPLLMVGYSVSVIAFIILNLEVVEKERVIKEDRNEKRKRIRQYKLSLMSWILLAGFVLGWIASPESYEYLFLGTDENVVEVE